MFTITPYMIDSRDKYRLLTIYENLSYIWQLSDNEFIDVCVAIKSQWEIFVARDDAWTIVWTITILIQATFFRGGKPAWHIENLVVDPKHQGKGIGTSLIQQAMDYARTQNCYKIILDCPDERVAMYARHGFQIKEHCMKYYIE